MASRLDQLDPIYPLDDVAAYLHKSVPTLRRWGREGKIELVRLPGGTLAIHARTLEEMTRPVGRTTLPDPAPSAADGEPPW